MDKQQSIETRYEHLDFIYIQVKSKGISTCIDLYNENKIMFDSINVDLEFLGAMLNKMVEDEYLLKVGDSGFAINPLNFEFISFKERYLVEKRQKKTIKTVDFLFKIIPIVCSILFGVVAGMISYSNLILTKQKAESEKNKFRADTLVVTFNKAQKGDTLLIKVMGSKK